MVLFPHVGRHPRHQLLPPALVIGVQPRRDQSVRLAQELPQRQGGLVLVGAPVLVVHHPPSSPVTGFVAAAFATGYRHSAAMGTSTYGCTADRIV
ncbi:hypothetical protein QFZ67_000301 [Streptomyces sp. V1I1]|nr:hypothetical protein [Streptomyces sp. V1I1]